ncbi:hypothetical protein AM10699_53500 [Acaryochloris marina MBIC10699]|nr:hypothetical protein AM10699_53500 [Acaryochloris marina MBIC10699]
MLALELGELQVPHNSDGSCHLVNPTAFQSVSDSCQMIAMGQIMGQSKIGDLETQRLRSDVRIYELRG